MPKKQISYFNAYAGPKIATYKQNIQKGLYALAFGMYNEVSFECKNKRSQGKYKIYGIRVGGAERYLFTIYEKHDPVTNSTLKILFPLVYLPTHNYNDYLVDPAIVDKRIEKLIEESKDSYISLQDFKEEAEKVYSSLPRNSTLEKMLKIINERPRISYKSFYNGKPNELSMTQQAILQVQGSFMIMGPPGSGKTLVLLEKMVTVLYQHLKDPKSHVRTAKSQSTTLNSQTKTKASVSLPLPLIYLTCSENLLTEAKQKWAEKLADHAKEEDKQNIPIAERLANITPSSVEFMLASDYVRYIKPEFQNYLSVEEEEFYAWLKNDDVQANFPITKCNTGRVLYHEITLAFSYPTEYLDFNSVVSKIAKSERDKIFKLLEAYQEHLTAKQKFDVFLTDLQRDHAALMIFLDEMQDFRHVRKIEELAQSTEKNPDGDYQLIGAGDFHQKAKNSQFTGKVSSVFDCITLSDQYRCPLGVTCLSNNILELNYYVTGGKVDDEAYNLLAMDVVNPIQDKIMCSTHIIDDVSLLNLDQLDFLNKVNANTITLHFKPKNNEQKNKAMLLTFEAAKGLEYPNVIIDLRDDRNMLNQLLNLLPDEEKDFKYHTNFPKHKDDYDNQDLAHYLELLYIAITRTKEKVFILLPEFKEEQREKLYHYFTRKNLHHQRNNFSLSEASLDQSSEGWFKRYIEFKDKNLQLEADAIYSFLTNEEKLTKNEDLKREYSQALAMISNHHAKDTPIKTLVVASPEPKNEKITSEQNNINKKVASTKNKPYQKSIKQNIIDEHKKENATPIQVNKKNIKENEQELKEKEMKERIKLGISLTKLKNNFSLAGAYEIIKETPQWVFLKEGVGLLEKENLLTLFKNILLANLSDITQYVYSRLNTHLSQLMDLKAIIPYIVPEVLDSLIKLSKSKEVLLNIDIMIKKFNLRIDEKHSNTTLVLSTFKMENLKLLKLLIKAGADVNKASEVNKEGQGNYPLLHACYKKPVNLDLVKLLLENGADVSCVNTNKWTALHIASSYGYLDIVKLLIQYKSSINQPAHNGSSPLFLACEFGHLETVRYLIEKGADVNQTLTGFSPLYVACQKGFTEVVKLLLEKGAKVNQAVQYNYSALLIAAEKGFIDIVKVLIEKKTDIHHSSVGGAFALYLASRNNHIDIVRLLILSGVNINQVTDNKTSALYIACEKGNVEVAKMLIENGASVDQVNDQNVSPLYIACQMGHTKIVELLLSNKADPRFIKNSSFTPIYIACEKGFTAIVKLLVQYGVNVNELSPYEIPLLNNACIKQNIEMVRFLIEQGVDVNGVNPDGYFPLYFCCQKGPVELVDYLISKGADVNKTHEKKDKVSALMIACHGHQLEIVKTLIENGADVNALSEHKLSPLYFACVVGNLNIVNLLLENGADVNLSDETKNSPINAACFNGHLEVMKLLIKNGSKMGVPAPNNVTLLYTACEKGRLDIVKFLIDEKVDLNDCAIGNFSPLSKAVERDHLEIVKLLIESGADIHLSSITNTSPLIMACEKGNLEIAKLLIKNGADINQRNNSGLTPWLAACHNGNLEIVKFLAEQGVQTNLNCFLPIDALNLSNHNQNSNANPNPNANLNPSNINTNPATPNTSANANSMTMLLSKLKGNNVISLSFSELAVAVYFGHKDVVKYFLDSQSVNILAAKCFAPLEIAVLLENEAMEEVLLSKCNADQKLLLQNLKPLLQGLRLSKNGHAFNEKDNLLFKKIHELIVSAYHHFMLGTSIKLMIQAIEENIHQLIKDVEAAIQSEKNKSGNLYFSKDDESIRELLEKFQHEKLPFLKNQIQNAGTFTN